MTRDGEFQLDASAQIVTSTGQSLAPPVQLPPGTDASAVRIDADGSVFVGGAQVGQIQLVGRGVIRQGALESSNVDLADTAVGTIVTRTSYAAAVQALHVQDEMWALAAGDAAMRALRAMVLFAVALALAYVAGWGRLARHRAVAAGGRGAGRSGGRGLRRWARGARADARSPSRAGRSGSTRSRCAAGPRYGSRASTR